MVVSDELAGARVRPRAHREEEGEEEEEKVGLFAAARGAL
jgi:hypothetical protein